MDLFKSILAKSLIPFAAVAIVGGVFAAKSRGYAAVVGDAAIAAVLYVFLVGVYAFVRSMRLKRQ